MRVPCPSCGFLYVIRASLTHHQTSCTTHRHSLVSKVPMPLTLSSSPPSALTWIASVNIIDVFHLGLPRPCSYHHIPYVVVLMFNVFYASLWFGWLLIHPTKQLGMHFCSPILRACHFCHRMVKKATKIRVLVCIGMWKGTRKHYKRNTQLEHRHWLPKDLQRWH